MLPGAAKTVGVTAGLLWLLLQVSLLSRSKSLSWGAYARTFSLSALAAWPGAGDGWSPSTNTYYDIKAFRPEFGEFTKETVQETIDAQIRRNGRKVILDTRNLTGDQLKDLRAWVEPEWRDDVLWYDGGLR